MVSWAAPLFKHVLLICINFQLDCLIFVFAVKIFLYSFTFRQMSVMPQQRNEDIKPKRIKTRRNANELEPDGTSDLLNSQMLSSASSIF